MTGVSSGAVLREIGNQFGQAARVHHGAGKLVRAEFARLFEDVDIFGGKLGLGARFVVLADQVARGASAQASPAGPAPTISTSASSRLAFEAVTVSILATKA